MDTPYTMLNVLTFVVVLLILIGLLVFLSGKRGGKVTILKMGYLVVVLLAAGTLQVDKMLSCSLLGIAIILYVIDFKRLQKKSGNVLEKSETLEDK